LILARPAAANVTSATDERHFSKQADARATGAAPDDGDDDDAAGDDDDDDDDEVADSAKKADAEAEDQGQEPPADGGEGFEVGSEIAVVSRYVWRGKALSQRPALQPELWATYRSVTASVWSNLLLTQEAGWHRLSAFEATLSYEFRWRFLKVEPHLTRYWFLSSNETSTTTELGASVTARTGPWFWTTTQDFDIEEMPGAYYGTLGGGARRRFGRWTARVAMDLAWANASFNEAHWGRAVSALDLVEGTAEVRYRLTNLVSAAVQGAVSTLISPELRGATTEPTLATLAFVLGLNR
jgi:hypothetical protein